MRMPFFLLFFTVAQTGFSQLLQEGMGVVTYGYSIGPGSGPIADDYSFLVYDFRDTYGDATGLVNPVTQYHPMTADSLQWKRSYMGDVFGTAIDTSGNIYLAYSVVFLTESYGPGVNGTAGIYRVNANDWSVAPLTGTDSAATYNPAFDTILPNTFSGLGDLCYDKWHNQLFVTNFEDGKIYRISTSGHVLSTFDPFLPDDAVMGLAPYGERLWGVHMNVHPTQGMRLYFGKVNEDGRNYASISPTLNNEVWSVAIDVVTGDFSGTEQFEVSPPETLYPGLSEPITDIVMGTNGDLYVGTRAMDSLSNSSHKASDYKYTWQGTAWSLPEQFYMGEFGRDATGGIDLGFSMDSLGNLYDEAVLWSSADRLSVLSPPQLFVYGYTGMPASGNSITIGDPDYYVAVNHVVPKISATGTYAQKTSPGDVEIFRKYYYDNPKPVSVVEQHKEALHFVLYPNPAQQRVQVLLHKKITDTTVKILDITGKLLLEMQYDETVNFSLDVSSFSAGMYTLLITADGFFVSEQFVKE